MKAKALPGSEGSTGCPYANETTWDGAGGSGAATGAGGEGREA
ncbi:hypothetical protein [Streptomyces antarcticus]|nr:MULTISPECIES: hypothetical protein [unclassified Streptomyces]MCY0945602.1 hypothetical protein [Streptomyces sp. H34-AA3]MCY0952142.1 hypothetical protein [Streptomyces sp. H27-S2]MCZ4087078.1 hypothetical protein [Streptomyces sp. H34-S5]